MSTASGAARPPVSAEVLGHHMTLHHPERDLVISRLLLGSGVFEPFETELLLDELRPGDTAVDVGANVGYYTLLFARRVGPDGRVFAFEPDPANFELLRRNVERNGYRNVVLSPLAASDRCGPARLFLSGSNAGDHRTYDPADGRPSLDIETVPLDRFFAGYPGPVDLVKMDIQGGEFAALTGMRDLLARQGRVKLATEFWPHGLRGAGASAAAYLDLLGRLGFRLFEVNEQHWCVARAEPERLLEAFPAGQDVFTNLLCVKTGDPVGPPAAGGDPAERSRWRRAGDLRAFERRVCSQNGEDGILEEVFRRIGVAGRFCVEIGAGDGGENNTARLIRDAGWGGLLLEASAPRFARLQERYRDRPDVRTARARVNAGNVEQLLREHRVPREFDLLSVDIDRDDYWVWAAVQGWRPRVVVIEYNASRPPPQRWVVKEDPGRAWDGTDHFGASLASLTALGRRKGYTLVGTNSTGVNAFFVLSEAAAGRFLDAELLYHYSPPRYGPRWDGHPPGTGEWVEV
jgi:FkbM family methyltransferase